MKLSKGENVREVQKDSVMTNQEIAEELGLTICQVRYICQQAMLKLRLKAIARNMQFEDYFE